MTNDERFAAGYANGYQVLTWFVYEMMQVIHDNKPRPDFNHAIESVVTLDQQQDEWHHSGIMAALQDMNDFLDQTRP